jgi:hypothetical protein
MNQFPILQRVSWFWLVLGLLGAESRGVSESLPEPKMTYLDNGEVRVGMDLALGGAVTFLSSRDHPGNVINGADLGRQIQMSHYSGPWPFVVGDKKPHDAWAFLGWNPIQTGDVHRNPSRVIEQRNNGKEIYVRCIPMQWPLENVPGDCVFETWTTLEGPVVHMRFRCTNRRADKVQYPPCPQELPAVYAVSKLWRVVSYIGDKPYTGDRLTQLTNDWHRPWPWARFTATEGWAALVDDAGWGLGVFKPDGGEFHGGVYGDGRSEDPRHDSTAYLAPVHMENFDHNIVYEHRTEFMLGRLEELRSRFNHMATKTPPAWRFQHDRQHWTLCHGTDRGLPLRGAWRIRLGEQRPQLRSDIRCWRAEDASELVVTAAYTGREPLRLQVFWRPWEEDKAQGLPLGIDANNLPLLWRQMDEEPFNAEQSLSVQLVPDGKFRTYRVNLGNSPAYRGLITRMAIEPAEESLPTAELAIRSIELVPTRRRNSKP